MKKILTICAMLCLPFSAQAAEAYAVLFKSQASFQEVRDLLQIAIEGKGLKINHSNHIADMLERTGQAVGATQQVYVKGEQFEFCSATISRQMMEADPHAMVMCPYIISVYTIPNDKNVYVSYRKPATTKNPALKKALDSVERLLTEIVKDAL